MKSILNRLWKEDEGQDLIEYVLLIALIGLATATAFPNVALAIQGVFTKANTCLSSASGTGC